MALSPTTPAEAARRKKQCRRLVEVSKQDVSHSMILAASPCYSRARPVETDRSESITSHHGSCYDRSGAQRQYPMRKAARGCAEALR